MPLTFYIYAIKTNKFYQLLPSGITNFDFFNLFFIPIPQMRFLIRTTSIIGVPILASGFFY